ncbi:hypothetical protein Tsubulata_041457, partial [Turnera subulata]
KGGHNDVKFKRGKSTNGVVSKSWSFTDPELRRKRRVASYKVYSVEGKLTLPATVGDVAGDGMVAAAGQHRRGRGHGEGAAAGSKRRGEKLGRPRLYRKENGSGFAVGFSAVDGASGCGCGQERSRCGRGGPWSPMVVVVRRTTAQNVEEEDLRGRGKFRREPADEAP